MAAPAVAQEFDFSRLNPLSWFGSGSPSPRADALPYVVTVEGNDSTRDLDLAARDASLLYLTRNEPPVDGEELARRIEADLPRVTDALWARGYYAAEVSIRIGQVVSRFGATDPSRLARAAEVSRSTALVPVVIAITPNSAYVFSQVAVIDARNRQPLDDSNLSARNRVTLGPGDTAATSAVLSATARLSDRFRREGHPFVKVTRRAPVIDHGARAVDLVLVVDPGPVATLGPVTVTGTKDVDPAVVRSFIYAEPGDPYSPQALADIRKSVARIEALSAVRVREDERLNSQGQLPLSVEVTERLPRLIGASARYSTTDGPALRGYWAHRNLFGGAERLRIDAELFYTVLDRDDTQRGFRADDLGGRLTFSFLKPALGGSRFDLLADGSIERSRTEAYDADLANGVVAIRRRFSDTFNLQLGLDVEAGKIRQAPSRFFPAAPRARTNYALAGLPFSLNYDSTDRPIDPTRGIKLTASIGPYAGFGDAAPLFGIGRIQASGYYAVDEDARVVLAARAGFGSVMGASFDEIPATRRFFAGGGGSVRGYDFKSLSPRDPFGRLTGGASLIEASFEARVKVTETIGIVPFVDVGQSFARALPGRSESLRIGAGLGFRYYTSLGPIRVDVAMPVQRRRGESPYALYVSIGQAF